MKENRILIVEDDLNILIGLEDNLKAEGYEVLTASTGDSGLQIALNEKVLELVESIGHFVF